MFLHGKVSTGKLKAGKESHLVFKKIFFVSCTNVPPTYLTTRSKHLTEYCANCMKRGIEIISAFFNDRRKEYSAVILFSCSLPHPGTCHPKLHIPIGPNLKEQSWFKFSLRKACCWKRLSHYFSPHTPILLQFLTTVSDGKNRPLNHGFKKTPNNQQQ